MKNKQVFYLAAGLNFASAILWLSIPNAARFIGFTVFMFAAFASFMAAKR